MTNVLVTGSDGFIGSNLIPELKLAGYQLLTLDLCDGDIANEETWSKVPGVEVVIHLAARTFVPDSWNHSHDFIRCNLLGTVAALNYCQKHHAKLIFLSSYLYGNPDLLPIREDAALKTNNPYSLSKKLAEEACLFYAESLGVPIIILRPFNIYGPGQPPNYLFQSIISYIKNGRTVIVQDLEPRRDYIYIDDVVQAIMKSVNLQSSFEIFNIGSGKSHSVADVIDMIQKITKTNFPVTSKMASRKDEIMDTVADIGKAKELLQWQPSIDLDTGLSIMVDSYYKIQNKHCK